MTSLEPATLTADDLVTGEGVALDLPAAGLGLRIASGLLDGLVTILLLIGAIALASTASVRADDALVTVAIIGVTIVVFVVVPTTVETLTKGKSVGKLALGLRVVRDDAGSISFQHALVRALVGYVELYASSGIPAFFSALVNNRGKRLGDHAAGTYVIRERATLSLPTPPHMPEHLAAWAVRADMTALPVSLMLAVRQFLSRSATIDPSTRSRIGHDLSHEVSQHVAPPPPSGTEPEDFLSAVLASRRERDLSRLQRDRALRERLAGDGSPPS